MCARGCVFFLGMVGCALIKKTQAIYFPFRDLISAMTESTIPSTDNTNAIIEIVFIILSYYMDREWLL